MKQKFLILGIMLIMISLSFAVDYYKSGCFNSNESAKYILTDDINISLNGSTITINLPSCINITHANSTLDLNNKNIYLYPSGTNNYYSTAIKIVANNVSIINGKIFIVRTHAAQTRNGIGIFTYPTYSNLRFENLTFSDAFFSDKSFVANGWGIYENFGNSNETADGLVFFGLKQDKYGTTPTTNYSNIYGCDILNRTLTPTYPCVEINASKMLEHEYFSGTLQYTNYNISSINSIIRVSSTDVNIDIGSDTQNIYYSGFTPLVSQNTIFKDILLANVEYPTWKTEILIPFNTEVLDFNVGITTNATHGRIGIFNIKNEKTNELITTNTGFTFFFANDTSVFSFSSRENGSSFNIARAPINRDLNVYGILISGYNTSIYAPRTDFYITRLLKNYTNYTDSYTLFALPIQYASSVLVCLYSHGTPLPSHFVVAKKFYASEGQTRRVATGLTNDQGKTYIILDVVQQLYNWEVYDFQGDLVYSSTVLEQIIPSQSGCSVILDVEENATQNLTAIGKYCECSMIGNITSQCSCRAFGNINFKWNMSVYAENGTLLKNEISYISPTTFYNVYNETVFVYISNDEGLFQFVHTPQTFQKRFETNYFFVAVSVLSVLFGIMFQPIGFLFPIMLSIVGLGNNLLDSAIAFMIIAFSIIGMLVSLISEIRKVGWKL